MDMIAIDLKGLGRNDLGSRKNSTMAPLIRGLTQQKAAMRMGITQLKLSGMVRGHFSDLSNRKLMIRLNRLGYGIEIKV
jgi:predicted XRE-type DNA-binding protein